MFYRNHWNDIEGNNFWASGFSFTIICQRFESYASFWKNIRLRNFVSLCTVLHCPCKFWLFLRLNILLKVCRFDNSGTIQTNVISALKTIAKISFQNCFWVWERMCEYVLSSRIETTLKNSMSRMMINKTSV